MRAGGVQVVERREADVGLQPLREGVDEQRDVDAARPVAPVGQVAERVRREQRQPAVAVDPEPAALQDAERRARQQVEVRGIRASRASVMGTSANARLARPDALLGVARVEVLRLDPGHVDAGRALGAAGLAADAGVSASPRPGSSIGIAPVSASRSRSARPRTVRRSSRVTRYGGHIVPTRRSRHEPMPMQPATSARPASARATACAGSRPAAARR